MNSINVLFGEKGSGLDSRIQVYKKRDRQLR